MATWRGAWLIFCDRDLAELGSSLADIAAGKQPIQACVAVMLPAVLLREGEQLRHREVVWFVGNSSSVGAIVKGDSRDPTLHLIAAVFWILTYRFQTRVRIGLVVCDSNWADGICRLYDADPFALANGFTTELMPFPRDVLLRDLPTFWAWSKAFEL